MKTSHGGEMGFDDYQRRSMRTAGKGDRLVLAALGLAGETGEIVEHIKKVRFHGRALDPEKLVGELGDLLWYLALAASEIDVSLSAVAERNLEKLAKRYPDGFSAKASAERLDVLRAEDFEPACVVEGCAVPANEHWFEEDAWRPHDPRGKP